MRTNFFFDRLNSAAVRRALKVIKLGLKKWPPKTEKIGKIPVPFVKKFFTGVNGKSILLLERQFSKLAVVGAIDHARRNSKISYDKLMVNKRFLVLAYKQTLNSFPNIVDIDRNVFTALAFGKYNFLVNFFRESKDQNYFLAKNQVLSKREFRLITTYYFYYMDYLFGYIDEHFTKN